MVRKSRLTQEAARKQQHPMEPERPYSSSRQMRPGCTWLITIGRGNGFREVNDRHLFRNGISLTRRSWSLSGGVRSTAIRPCSTRSRHQRRIASIETACTTNQKRSILLWSIEVERCFSKSMQGHTLSGWLRNSNRWTVLSLFHIHHSVPKLLRVTMGYSAQWHTSSATSDSTLLMK